MSREEELLAKIERQREALRGARDALVDAQQTIAEIGLSDIAQEEALAAIDAVLKEIGDE